MKPIKIDRRLTGSSFIDEPLQQVCVSLCSTAFVIAVHQDRQGDTSLRSFPVKVNFIMLLCGCKRYRCFLPYHSTVKPCLFMDESISDQAAAKVTARFRRTHELFACCPVISTSLKSKSSCVCSPQTDPNRSFVKNDGDEAYLCIWKRLHFC